MVTITPLHSFRFWSLILCLFPDLKPLVPSNHFNKTWSHVLCGLQFPQDLAPGFLSALLSSHLSLCSQSSNPTGLLQFFKHGKRDPASGLWTSCLLSGALLCKLLIRYCLLSEAPSGLFPQAAGSPWLFSHLTDRCLLAHCLLNLGLPTGRQNLGGSLSSLWLHQLQLEWGLAFNKYLLNGWMNE